MEDIAVRKTAKPVQSARRLHLPKLRGRSDFVLLLLITALCAFGLVMVFSASYYYASHNVSTCHNDGYYYLKRQLLYLAIGYPTMLIISLIDYRKLDKISWLFILISVGLLVAVLLFGQEKNGGRRWLNLAGLSIQPSEVAKFGMMFCMCSFMAKRRERMKDFKTGILPMLFVIGVVCGLIMLQPNMSMAVIVGVMGVVLLYLGGCNLRFLVFIGAAGVILFLLLAFAADYRSSRMTTFLNPWSDPQGDGYQLCQSYYAIGSGGLFGKGLNNSYQKLLYMVYGESDFIFAILCEEFGLVGGALVILAYGAIVYRGMRVSLRCKNRFGSLLAAGISIVFGFQVFVNVGVVVGLLPTTGQALPFISAGGTSLLIFLAAMGVLLNISRDLDMA